MCVYVCDLLLVMQIDAGVRLDLNWYSTPELRGGYFFLVYCHYNSCGVNFNETVFIGRG